MRSRTCSSPERVLPRLCMYKYTIYTIYLVAKTFSSWALIG